LKVVIVTTGRDYIQAHNFVKQVKNASAANGYSCPRILALSLASQSPDVAVAFEKLGAHYLLRAYSEQIVDVVKKIQWQCRTKNSLPTIAIRRLAGHVAHISVKYGCGEAQIEVGPKLRELIEYLVLHSRTEHTTEMIADALGVCRQSVKEYLLRLRRAFNRACEGTSIGARGEQVFWTRKISGGYVHGTTANVEIEDVEEFSHV
jgi:DNA-binding response OmpR family regulator